MSDSKVSVTITNRAPGIHPPLYVAGNYSNPEWVPEPMEYTASDGGVYTFTKTLQVQPESKIIYKFRAGEGDWWLLNENAPTETDLSGNRNNVLEAPKAAEPEVSEEPVTEAVPTSTAELTENSSEDLPQDDNAGPEIVQPQAVPHLEDVKQSDQVDPERTSTPEVIKTITEVSESAALLDRSTPEPEIPETIADENEDQASSTLLPDVADSAALLDCPTTEAESDIDAMDDEKEAPSDVAAEVADTAAKLDAEVDGEAPSEVAAEVADTAAKLDAEVGGGAPSDVAAQVPDTAAESDSTGPEADVETVSPTYKTLADVKADMKDDSLEITGFSNDHEPVPLFAHECAGLYEDDEIPGVDEQSRSSSSAGPSTDDKEDYDDPMLEKFPLTRDEIISTVRKVGTGLNADQVLVEGVPPSPIFHAGGSPTVEARNEPRASDTSSLSRGQQYLPLPPSLTSMDERSRSTASLQSIDEGAEEAEGTEEDGLAAPQSEYIADVVEKSNDSNDTTEIFNETEPEPIVKPTINEIVPVVEQAETADEVIGVAQNAEGDQGQDIGLTDADLSAGVEVTPAAENIAPVSELPVATQDIASVVEQENTADDGSTMVDLDTEQGQQLESNQIGETGFDGEAAPESNGNDTENTLSAQKPSLLSVVTVPSPLVKPSVGLLSPVSDDDEAVVVKTTNGDDETIKSGYLTPERAATPQPEEPGSPREPTPNAADPIAESDSEPPVLEGAVDAPLPEPKSPQIVVSKPEETLSEDKLSSPTPTLDEVVDENSLAEHEDKSLKEEESPEVGANQASREIETTDDHESSSNVEETPVAEAPLDSSSFQTDEISNDHESPATVNGSGEAEPHSENTATTSATEEIHASALTKRSIAQPDPADRSGTPISINDHHKEVAKGANWFSAFLRLIFIDFVGGVVRKITGGGRKTLVMAVVVLVAVGYPAFRRITEVKEQVVSH